MSLFNYFFGNKDNVVVTVLPPVRPEIRELILHIRNPENKWTHNRVDYDYRTTRWCWQDVEVDYVYSPINVYIILSRPGGVVSLNKQEQDLIKAAFDGRLAKIKADLERKQLDELHVRLNSVAVCPKEMD